MSQTSVADGQSLPFAGVIIEKLSEHSATSSEVSAEIPFGVMVQRGASDDLALLLAGAAATDLIGVVAHSHAHAKDLELGTTGLKPKATFSIMRIGSLWVTVEDAVTAFTTAVRCRHTAGAGGTVLGAFRGAAVAGETFLLTGAKWLSSASGGARAKLEVNMTVMVATADV